MDQEIKTWLYDVLNAIIEIESFFVDTIATFEIYQKDLKTKRAVERNIEIIGEAFQRILKKENTINITDARKIINTRNKIIHGYDNVSDQISWEVIKVDLPNLRNEISTLLNED